MTAIGIGIGVPFIQGGASDPPLNFLQTAQASLLYRPRASLSFAQTGECSLVPRVAIVAGFDALAWRDILTGAGHTVHYYLNASAGLTESGGAVTDWVDQAASPKTMTIVDAPAYNATGLNNRPIVSTDGSNDAIDVTWNPDPPGTTSVGFYAVVRMNAGNAAGDRFFGGGGNQLSMRRAGSDGTVNINSGTASFDLTMTVATWYRIWGFFNDSATLDEFVVGGSSTGTGVSFGNGNAGAFAIGHAAGTANFGAWSFPLITKFTGKPSGTTIAALDAVTVHDTNGYGSGVVVA
jgi:hypothetical protein